MSGAFHRLARAIALAVGGVLLLLLLVQAWFFAQVLWLRDHDPLETSFMAQRLAAMRAVDPGAELRHIRVPYDRISVHLKRAVVAAEDARFAEHEGFDWEGMQKAMEKNQRRGRTVAGGSTISQQLAKNLFLSGDRSVLRKAQEAVITLMLEAVLDKRRILELYLNVAEWGEGVFGAEAAARHHFGVSAAQLGPTQSARLAAMLPRPRFYDRNPGSAYLAAYAQRILGRMPAAQVP